MVCNAHVVAEHRGDWPCAGRISRGARCRIDAAQQALDVFWARGGADLVTVDTANEHIVVWQDAGRSAMRIVCTNFFNADVGVPTVVVRDAAGDIKPTPAPNETWPQSMRYYRQAQLSDSL